MKIFEYDAKCRVCGKVATIYFGHGKHTPYEDFMKWVSEHSTFPIMRKCDGCEKTALHDLISYEIKDDK